jgi:hypothetical protein
MLYVRNGKVWVFFPFPFFVALLLQRGVALLLQRGEVERNGVTGVDGAGQRKSLPDRYSLSDLDGSPIAEVVMSRLFRTLAPSGAVAYFNVTQAGQAGDGGECSYISPGNDWCSALRATSILALPAV